MFLNRILNNSMMTIKTITSPVMIYNKITLAFSEKDEEIFKQKYFSDSLFQFRIAFVLLIILYGVFGYLDSRMVPEYAKSFHIIRYIIVIPIFLLVFLLSFTGLFRKVWQLLLLISFIVGGTGISIMTMLVPENYAYYAGMMLIFSAGYFFIKLRFFLAAIAGWSTLLIFNIGSIYYAHTPDILLINNNFFFISANLIGMFAAYNIEYYTRRNFFLNQKLDSEKLLVEEVNKNLEQIVEERTKELVKAKEHAEESDKLKTAFLTNMSHEIRTPMNGILGFAELLKMPGISGEQQQEYIRIIKKSGDRMLNIITDIVDISKIESGQMHVAVLDTRINEQTEDIYNLFNSEAEKKGIQFTYKNGLSDAESAVKTDDVKVYAILTNLVKNAIKYTDRGSIEFGYKITNVETLHATSLLLQFYVKDTGIGIPANRQHAIFDRFVQADIADTRAFQGAGLGLSISKAYVKMLGGEIWVESEEGIGSTFCFSIPFIPAVNSKEHTAAAILPDVLADKIKKLKILIVEDDETSEMLIRIVVRDFCDKILTAVTGIEAIALCHTNPDIDLILMDIKMAEMDGYEATRQIRTFNKDVVIIAQTAFGMEGDHEKAIDSGCNDYISKPLDIALMKNLIQLHLK